MKAVVFDQYGPPDVLRVEEVDKPVPGDDEILVKVHTSSVNAADWHLLRADPFLVRLYFGLFKPRYNILGADAAGTVEATGKSVRDFEPGDEVFGDLSESGWGAFADYACASEKVWVKKPASITFQEAAAAPLASVAALQALRDRGEVKAGHKVLVNGASGGVGTFAVQIAKSLGAEVTGVCSTRNLEMVRSLGADHVIDYTKEDFTRNRQHYDLILDTAAFRSMFAYRRSLSRRGIYVLIGGDRMFTAMLLGPVVSMPWGRKMRDFLHKPDQGDLLLIKELLQSGKVRSVIDKSFRLSEVPEAIHYQEKGHTQGKVVIYHQD
ncbi:MAG: NAD(P)-dependent alcohol dehydrogenase [Pseudomonadota bacterium]|jgi:NADPH:quinone reductase-like Zn-dependent oxidoreductase